VSVTAALGRRRGYFLLALAAFVADQATKIAAHAWLRDRAPLPVVPDLFDLSYSRNPGGLFGSFAGWDSPWRALLLTVLPLVAIALIGRSLVAAEGLDRATRVGLALILGGATGNLCDRLIRGEVVDFLDVYASAPRLADWLIDTFGTAHWPTFNVADSCIVVGAGLLLVAIVRPRPAAAAIADADATAGENLPR
jgi:signal peptidase II